MINKPVVNQLCKLLRHYRVNDIVVSPGSRNAPLIVAFAHAGCYKMHYIVDERQAAFVALGISVTTGNPVACVCTSGSAVLNYGPAAAEACYSSIPLVFISADRPYYAIDCGQPQTIRQAGVLDHFVRMSIDIRDGEDQTYSNKLINAALRHVNSFNPGPVHINVQLDTPLVSFDNISDLYAEVIQVGVAAPPRAYLNYNPSSRYLLVIGGLKPDQNIETCREFLKSLPNNVAVIAEVQSNLSDCSTIPAGDFAHNLDLVEEPDVIIIAGTPPADNRILNWIDCQSATKIHIDPVDHIYPDIHLETSLSVFLAIFSANGFYGRKTNYCRTFQKLKPAPVSQVSALVGRLAGLKINLHLSNGMTIREAQKVKAKPVTAIWCNRGVSGIEGSLSTAIGASMVSDTPVVLICGDMSAAYDISALAINDVATSFTMVVVNNGGGEIFRQVATTRNLPEREQYFTPLPKFPLRQLAEAYGFDFQSVSNPDDATLSDGVKPRIVELVIE